LSAPANLFWLSPGGIWIGSGAKITNAQNLLLTTALGMQLGRNYFDALSTKKGGINSLNQGPNLNFSELSTPDGNPYSLGLMGSGSIVLEGGLISVDRNLLLNATGGNLRTVSGYGTQLYAGSSIWLAGHQVDLNDVAITAGQPGQWGLIDVRSSANQDAAQQGSVHLDSTLFKGQQILISSGDISLNKSRLEAPKGWIQLVANNSSTPAKGLSISSSVLDVSAYRLEDLNAPAIKSGPTELETIRINYPKIGLFSNQDIYISNNSTINASLDVSTFLNNKPLGNDLDMFKIADRSGIAFLKASGKILIDSSTISTDSSSTMAGQIYLQADGKDQLGGIYVENSNLFSRYGAGDGRITLSSAGGIAIKGSTLDVSTNRLPIVDGETSALTNSGAMPFAFRGGKIYLINKTDSSNPIQIGENSSLLARKSTAGGGLESPLLGFRQVDQISKYGILGSLDSFSIGYDIYTGGNISINSEGGINIANSHLDVSSGDPPYENTAGTISLLDTSQMGIELKYSFLGAMTGKPLDITIKESGAGGIYLAAKSAFLADHSSIIANNYNTLDVSSNTDRGEYSLPIIAIQSSANSLAFRDSILQATYVNYPISLSDEYNGINLTSVPIVNERTLFQPSQYIFNASFELQELKDIHTEGFNRKAVSVEGAYGIANLPRVTDKNQNLSSAQFIPTNQSQQNTLLSSRNSQSVSINIDQDTASSKFMESQNRSMIETAKALGLTPGTGKLRSIAELQQRLSLASKLSASSQLLAPVRQAQTSELTGLRGPIIQPYSPAILHLQRDDQASGNTRINAILLTAQGEPISRSSEVPRADLDAWISGIQRQLSRRSPLPGSARDPAQQLSQALIEPLLPSLRQQGITALLLEVDRGLQAIPYGALPVQVQSRDALLGDLYAITLTPSLGLIDLDPGQKNQQLNPGQPSNGQPSNGQPSKNGQMLLAGASQFSNGLAPLPMVRQELQALGQEHPSQLLLNEAFTSTALMEKALASQVGQLHIATHVSFIPGQASTGLLYTPTAALSLAELGRSLRSRSSGNPLDLITLSACLTALGDEQSELGFVGMALQAGARSGLGSLWEVDDTATAAFYIQLYRYIKWGLAKDQALQATQQAFLHGEVKLVGDRLVGPNQLTGQSKSTLVSGLSREEQTLFTQGLSHPYYWAGMILTGSPW
jgi:CHAT domain-containing protein